MINSSQKLRNKFDIPIRWALNGVYVNYFASRGKIKRKFIVKGYGSFQVDESNIGTIILICCGIEFFGRLLLGYRYEHPKGITEQSFIAFVYHYLRPLNPNYYTKSKQLLNNYRNSLVHSYVLGYKSKRGFFPTRNKRQYHDRHLGFLPRTRRLILNIDMLVNDFHKAVENYWSDVNNDVVLTNLKLKLLTEPKYKKLHNYKKITIKTNALNSLKDF